MENLTGKHLGPYRIVAPLGEGGMATVYKAFQPGVDRYVALKILARHYADDPNFVARFRQEAQVIANLQHPHILQVYDFGEAEGYTYIVMPFVEYGTLADLVNSHPLSLKQIRTIIAQVGDALDYAHSRGLVHRDVKPSNVLIDERGNCLLTDFGIAKIVEGSARLTTTGTIMGTPAYMSPEQGLAQKIDGRSDIYSLGVMLYQMATGRVPFDAETPMAIVIKHIHDPLPPPRIINPALPEAVERVIWKALAKNPEDRYQTAGAMVEAIQATIPASTAPLDQSPIADTFTEDRAGTMGQAKAAAQTQPPTSISEKAKSGLPKWILAVSGLALIVIIALLVLISSLTNLNTATRATGTPLGLTVTTAELVTIRPTPLGSTSGATTTQELTTPTVLALSPSPVTTTQAPQFIKTISIPSNTNAGITLTVLTSGTYIFQYGANSAFWSGVRWATEVLAFRGAVPKWANSTTLSYESALFAMGDHDYTFKQSAIDSTRGKRAIIRLDAGELITLVAADSKSYYYDNTGEIVLDIFLVP